MRNELLYLRNVSSFFVSLWISLLNEKREQAKEDLKGLEDTVVITLQETLSIFIHFSNKHLKWV